MKFFFSKTDSLYKIFKALEKIPSYRKVEIYIDPEHSLFDNDWWWYQIKEILDKKKIDATFVAKNKNNRNYYKSIWLNVNLQKEKKLEKSLNILYLFFFNIKKFHLHAYESKKYIFVFIFIIEILFILWIFRFIISLVVPSVSITIQPSEESETIIYNVRYYPNNDTNVSVENRFLNVPFYTWSLDYKYDLTTSVANMKFVVNPSYWKIKIYNKRDKEYEIVGNTQFITSDGLIFYSQDDFVIPAWNEKNPSEITIVVRAWEYDEYDNIIWVRWNIPFKTQLLIKKLEESYYAKDIWAESIEDFVWWQAETVWSITNTDVEMLKQKLVDHVYWKKMSIVSQNFPIKDWFILPFETITTTVFNDIEVQQQDDEKTPIIKWTAYVTYNYVYVLWKDLYQIFMTFVNERQSISNAFIKIDENSVQFLKNSDTTQAWEIKKDWKIFIISTQVDIIQSYNFENDDKWIISEIKDKIAWMNVEDARKYILSSYDEIWNVDVSVPLMYDSIPMVKSRIKIKIK